MLLGEPDTDGGELAPKVWPSVHGVLGYISDDRLVSSC